jgi:hypothetical protein
MNKAIRIGIVAALAAAVFAVRSGTVTPTTSGYAACVPFPAGFVDDGGLKTVRVDSALFPRATLVGLGFTVPAGVDEAYGGMEIQGYPALDAQGNPDLAQLVDWPAGVVEVQDDATVTLRASPAAPSCQIAIRLQGAASAQSVFKCACASDATCLWTGVDGGPNPGPKGLTFQPGTFSGAGCIRKPCVELAGHPSMPAACQ